MLKSYASEPEVETVDPADSQLLTSIGKIRKNSFRIGERAHHRLGIPAAPLPANCRRWLSPATSIVTGAEMRLFKAFTAERNQIQKDRVHFLHIGKTGGSALRRVLSSIRKPKGTHFFQGHKHKVKLRDLPDDVDYFFSIREPVARFVSAFNSRKRMGAPRYRSEWSPLETAAFKRFEHATDLAESIFDDGRRGASAITAMQSIRHVKDFQVDWFPNVETVFYERPPVFIIRQDNLADDLVTTLRILDISQDNLPDEVPIVHANDYSNIPPLSEKAVKNLQQWYCRDIAFVNLANAWCEERLAALR